MLKSGFNLDVLKEHRRTFKWKIIHYFIFLLEQTHQPLIQAINNYFKIPGLFWVND